MRSQPRTAGLLEPLAGLDAAQAALVESIARRANASWTERFVYEHTLCPFARPAVRAGRSVVRVCLQPIDLGGPAPAPLLAAVDEIADDEGVEEMQWIVPRVRVDAAVWEEAGKRWTAEAQRRRGGSVVAVAAFHPALPWHSRSERGLLGLLRRTPDPTLQWLRLDALDRIREGRPEGDVFLPADPGSAQALLRRLAKAPLSQTVAERNARTVAEIGAARLEAALDALAETTREAYAALTDWPGAGEL